MYVIKSAIIMKLVIVMQQVMHQRGFVPAIISVTDIKSVRVIRSVTVSLMG